MPELPEVETILQGIKPHIQNQIIKNVIVRQFNLRWPVPKNINKRLMNKQIKAVERRAKYLLLKYDKGTIILHLGMSGRLRVLTQPIPVQKHDHIDLVFKNNITLRFSDPRRFGTCLLTTNQPDHHPLLKNLGPEPFDKIFTAKYLWECAQNRKIMVKSFIMNNEIVVGIGNIYAAEALFLAKINPQAPANTITLKQYDKLYKAIKYILQQAIKRGGTTLRDFVNSNGSPGYFTNQLNVYGRAGLPCIKCGKVLISYKIGQRSTVHCSYCQS